MIHMFKPLHVFSHTCRVLYGLLVEKFVLHVVPHISIILQYPHVTLQLCRIKYNILDFFNCCALYLIIFSTKEWLTDHTYTFIAYPALTDTHTHTLGSWGETLEGTLLLADEAAAHLSLAQTASIRSLTQTLSRPLRYAFSQTQRILGGDFTFSFLTASFTTSVPLGASTSVFPRNCGEGERKKKRWIHQGCDSDTVQCVLCGTELRIREKEVKYNQ